MGKRGPKPTPSVVLRARGSWRGKVNRAEPQFDTAAPGCPDWLDVRAKEYWAALAQWLGVADVLRVTDGFAMARYCQLLARWRKCEEFVQKHGDTYPVKDKGGAVVAVKEFPQVRRASDLSAQCAKFEAEFGLTPSARSRIIAGAGDAPAVPSRPAQDGPPVMRIAN